MLVIDFQASKSSGSEEEDFLIFFYVFLWLPMETYNPWPEAILDAGTYI